MVMVARCEACMHNNIYNLFYAPTSGKILPAKVIGNFFSGKLMTIIVKDSTNLGGKSLSIVLSKLIECSDSQDRP